MNATKQQANNNKGANAGSFLDFLGAILGESAMAEIKAEMEREQAEKKELSPEMQAKVDEVVEAMKEEVKEHGDMATGSVTVSECPCGKCGAVKVEMEFTAYKLTSEGMGVTEGKMETVIRAD